MYHLEPQPFLGKDTPAMHWLKRDGEETPIAVFGAAYGALAQQVADLLNGR